MKKGLFVYRHISSIIGEHDEWNDAQKNDMNNIPSENTNIRNTMNNIIIITSYFLIYSLITSLIQ